MNASVLPYALLCLLGVFLASISQVMLKKAALRSYSGFWQQYLNPLVISAYVLLFVPTILGVFAYRVMPVNLGTVLETTSYLYVTFFGVVIFKEKLSVKKVLALVLIILGVLVYAVPFHGLN